MENFDTANVWTKPSSELTPKDNVIVVATTIAAGAAAWYGTKAAIHGVDKLIWKVQQKRYIKKTTKKYAKK